MTIIIPQWSRSFAESGKLTVSKGKEVPAVIPATQEVGAKLSNGIKPTSSSKFTAPKIYLLNIPKAKVTVSQERMLYQLLVFKNIPDGRVGHKRSKSTKTTREQSAERFQKQKNDELSHEGKYSVFTSQDPSNMVVVSETPVSGRTIQRQMFEGIHLNQFVQVTPILQIYSASDSGKNCSLFMFDSVRNELQSQERFFLSEIKLIVSNFIQGRNGSVLFFGPTGSGKSFSMIGKTGTHKGVVPRAIQQIFGVIENSSNDRLEQRQSLVNQKVYLRAAVYLLHCDNVYDLISNGSRKVKVEKCIDKVTNELSSQMIGLTERVLLTQDQFFDMMNESYEQRKGLSSRLSSFQLSNQDLKFRSHFVVQLTLVCGGKNGFEDLSKLNFVELAGSEQSVSNSDTYMRDAAVRQFVSNSFNSLSEQILRIAIGKKQRQQGCEESILIKCLSSTLTKDSDVLLINCCSPNQNQYQHTLPAIKFCAKIREKIAKKNVSKQKQKKLFEIPENYFSNDFFLNEFLVKVQKQILAIDFKLQQGSKLTDEDYRWCIQNLDFINKAAYDCRKQGKTAILESLDYQKMQIHQFESKYLSQKQKGAGYDKLFDREKEKVFNSLIKTEKGKFSPLRIKNKMDETKKVEDELLPLTNYQHLKTKSISQLTTLQSQKSVASITQHQDNLVSSQMISERGKPKIMPSQIYEDTDQANQDIKRIFYLDDYAGLKQRVTVMVNERLACNELINDQKKQIKEFIGQLDQKDKFIREIQHENDQKTLRLNDQVQEITDQCEAKQMEAVRKCNEQIRMWEDQYEAIKSESDKHLEYLETSLTQTQSNYGTIKQIKDDMEKRYANAIREIDELKKLHRLTEEKCGDLQFQNEKLAQQYKVLKEHEQDMTDDFTELKNSRNSTEGKCGDLQTQNERLSLQYRVQKDHEQDLINDFAQAQRNYEASLSAKQNQLELIITEKDQIIADLNKEMKDIDDYARLQNHEIVKFQDREKISSGQLHVLECRVERYQRDNEDLAQRIKNLYKDIQQRDEQLDSQVETCQIETAHRDANIVELQSNVDDLSANKEFLNDCLSNKNEEVKLGLTRVKEANDTIKRVQDDYRNLERQLTKLKFDEQIEKSKTKVEYENTINNLLQELASERNKTNQAISSKDSEIAILNEHCNKLIREIEQLKRLNEDTLTTFDKKFTNFNQDLGALQQDNQQMAEAESSLRRIIHRQELDIVELREKCRYLEIRHFSSKQEMVPTKQYNRDEMVSTKQFSRDNMVSTKQLNREEMVSQISPRPTASSPMKTNKSQAKLKPSPTCLDRLGRFENFTNTFKRSTVHWDKPNEILEMEKNTVEAKNYLKNTNRCCGNSPKRSNSPKTSYSLRSKSPQSQAQNSAMSLGTQPITIYELELKVKQMFQQFDQDKSGFLDQQETKLLFTGLNNGKFDKVQYDAFMSQIDTNNDKAVDLKELTSFFIKQAQSNGTLKNFVNGNYSMSIGNPPITISELELKVKQIFQQFDTDKSGFLDQEETKMLFKGLNNGNFDKVQYDAFMSQLDKNNDKAVDLEELTNFFIKYAQSKRILKNSGFRESATNIKVHGNYTMYDGSKEEPLPSYKSVQFSQSEYKMPQPFQDIQAMIQTYKKEREQYREKRTTISTLGSSLRQKSNEKQK